jgi:SAM-dependent methyltransferase
VKDGASLLDLGCCFGQELRKLVFDGAPASRLYGADLRPEYIELGYELFRDRETLTAKFFTADILAEDDTVLSEIKGKTDIVYVGSFLHLFDYDGQVRAAKAIVSLLRPGPGVIVLGGQVGSIKPRVVEVSARTSPKPYLHNVETFEKLWEQVGRETGTSWKVDAKLSEGGGSLDKPIKGTDFFGPDSRRLVFMVERV